MTRRDSGCFVLSTTHAHICSKCLLRGLAIGEKSFISPNVLSCVVLGKFTCSLLRVFRQGKLKTRNSSHHSWGPWPSGQLCLKQPWQALGSKEATTLVRVFDTTTALIFWNSYLSSDHFPERFHHSYLSRGIFDACTCCAWSSPLPALQFFCRLSTSDRCKYYPIVSTTLSVTNQKSSSVLRTPPLITRLEITDFDGRHSWLICWRPILNFCESLGPTSRIAQLATKNFDATRRGLNLCSYTSINKFYAK